jgi:acetyl-CoA carboxylase carboxyl transferase subunit alpha
VLIQLEAEERGQGEAIARNIFEMVRLKCLLLPLLGEGASGGALGRSGRSRLYAGKHLVFCNFSESCSSILWKSWEYKEIAAEALKLTSSDMKRQK